MRSVFALVFFIPFFFSCKQSNNHEVESNEAEEVLEEPIISEKLSSKEINDYKNKLTNLFDSNLMNRNFNGGVIVAKGGNILYENYTGFINPLKKDQPITDTTSFHLASTSKPFTGVAVLKLIQQGKIHLNDDVALYLPGFPYAKVTIKDLLSHRSGLPNYLYFMEDKQKWPAGRMVSNNDVLSFLIQYQPALNYKPGTRFNYCNTNYVLLALIIEKLTGKTYPDYLKEAIFKPLGMKHSFVYTPADSGKVVVSYRPSGALWEHDIFDNTYGDKNIYSTPRDMVKWDAALYDNNFISHTLLDSAYQPLSNERPSIHNYGLGWRLLNLKNGKKVIYHNGKWHGFTPAFARLCDEKAVIVILGNKMNSSIYGAAKLAYNVFGDYMQNEPAVDEDVSPHQSEAPKPVVKKAEPHKVDRTVEPNKNKLRKTTEPVKQKIPEKTKTAKAKNEKPKSLSSKTSNKKEQKTGNKNQPNSKDKKVVKKPESKQHK